MNVNNFSIFNREALQAQTQVLEYELRETKNLFDFWVKFARSQEINVDLVVKKMQEVVNILPSRQDETQILTVALLCEFTMIKIYCNKIIRKSAQELIEKHAKIALALPKLANKRGLILDSKKYLVGLLPPKRTLQRVQMTEIQYERIQSEIERMTHQIIGPDSLN